MTGSGDSPVAAALAAVLRPLARLAMARGIGYATLQRLIKAALVDAARRLAPGASQSRLSLMTGVHRKDVRALLAEGVTAGEPARPSIAQTVMARWVALGSDDGDGRPPELARAGEGGFDALVAGISRDVRPRAVLEEMRRLGLVEAVGGDIDSPAARLRLAAEAHVPGADGGDESERLGLFAANLADHAGTAVGNLEASPGSPRRLERAVFHTHLSPDSVADLEAEARRLGMDALIALNRRALDLQRRDIAAGTATRRFRYGIYFHDAPLAADADGDEAGEDGAGPGESKGDSGS